MALSPTGPDAQGPDAPGPDTPGPDALVPEVTLTGGTSMPVLGLGTWPMSEAEAERAVAEAIGRGYRLIDTAHLYQNEAGVGRGIRAAGVPRERLFITTKLARQQHGRAEARAALEASLRTLGMDYVDLYLIHWPVPWQDRYVDTWRTLIELREAGLTRAIGVSNFKPAHLDRLITETGVTPEVNQIQLNPTVSRAAARAHHAGHGIVTQSWSPIDQGKALFESEAVRDLAARHNRTPAQVVLRWHLDHGLTAVPKTTSPERMSANLDVFGFTLSPEEMAALDALDRGEDAAVDSDTTGY